MPPAALLSSRRRLFWTLQITGWLLVVPFFAILLYSVFPQPFQAIALAIIRQLLGFGLTLALWRIYRRIPASRFRLVAHLWKIFAACLLAGLIDLAATDWIQNALGFEPFPGLVQRGAAVLRLSLYLAWSAFYFVIRQEVESTSTELQLARAEAANREAEIQLLRAQMNPHFLFNALNALTAEIEDDASAAIRSTRAIADYLRYSLTQRGHRAPLGDELDAMANYLAVERHHHAPDSFSWEIQATDAARAALAPTALVQPLIENALKYGSRPADRPLTVRVDATVDRGWLVVAVENTGRWREPRPAEISATSTGIGLDNIRRRLALLFDHQAELRVTTPPGWVRVEARIPDSGI